MSAWVALLSVICLSFVHSSLWGVPRPLNIHTIIFPVICAHAAAQLRLTHLTLIDHTPWGYIYRDFIFSKRGTGLWACMCTIIELNSNMTECAKKSSLLPEGLFRWNAAVYRQQKTCCEPHHTNTSSYIVWEISSTRLPNVLLDWNAKTTCLATLYKPDRLLKHVAPSHVSEILHVLN